MDKRVFTVGSLIPGNVNPLESSVFEPTPLKVEKVGSPKIVIMQNEQSYEITPLKGNLLEVALAQGKPLQYKCLKGTCGQCKVKIEDAHRLSNPNEQEQKKLQKELNEGYRLACQVQIY
ncbi:2Fe-2S iron-sulfur cluster-binding protein [Bacillus sp. CGMCC 1.16607]|uniref:2Fe-2S iron-sulfur cluster-binding protein n=1 Tax=Bacillus sp. CGMCC 1.16607 TaxID=3351842 RepID=UPI003643BFDF